MRFNLSFCYYKWFGEIKIRQQITYKTTLSGYLEKQTNMEHNDGF